jgi:Ca-activated chloride channel family protein
MSFAWPFALAMLVLVPFLALLHLWQLRRRRRQAVRYSDVALVRAALPRRSRLRRHVPVALFLASVASLGLAAARPQVALSVPLGRTTIILALDVSRSMCATDVEPNRLHVAQDAARTFVKDQVAGTRIGIVAFAGTAELVVRPTNDRQALIDAIDRLTTARGTVIGAAILKSVDAIAEVNPDVAPAGADPLGSAPTAPMPPVPPTDGGGAGGDPSAGDYVPDIVVLLTDGANTRGVEPVEAAQQAAARRVRVYTIGFGTTSPTSMVCTREQLGGDTFSAGASPDVGGFGGGGGGGGRQFLVIDEPTLQAVADTTGGEFHRAEDAGQLQQVFEDLPSRVELQKEEREVSVAFGAAGIALTLLAIGLSLRWNPYP